MRHTESLINENEGCNVKVTEVEISNVLMKVYAVLVMVMKSI